jgi:hypothetical protein
MWNAQLRQMLNIVIMETKTNCKRRETVNVVCAQPGWNSVVEIHVHLL